MLSYIVKSRDELFVFGVFDNFEHAMMAMRYAAKILGMNKVVMKVE